MIDEDVTLGQSTARAEKKGAVIKQIDSRCQSGIGTEIIHGMNYLEDRRDLAMRFKIRFYVVQIPMYLYMITRIKMLKLN